MSSTMDREQQATKTTGQARSGAPAVTAIAAAGRSDVVRPDGGKAASETKPVAGSAAKLGLAVGEDRLLVDLSEAGEIVPLPPAILPVPLTRDWLCGITNFRGSLFTVVDLRRFAIGQLTETGKESRILALSEALDFNVTLIVTRMLGLRNTASMKPMAKAPKGDDASLVGKQGLDWLGQCHVDAEGHIWREVSLSKLARDPSFLMVGRY